MLKSKTKTSLLSLMLFFGISLGSGQAFSAVEAIYNIAAGETATRHFEHNMMPGMSTFQDTILFNFDAGVTAASIVAVEYDFFNPGLENVTASLYDFSGSTSFGSGSVTSFTSSPPLTLDISASDIGNVFKLIVTGDVGMGGAYGVQISAVPLPAAAWLFISGFLAIGGWSVFKRKREQNLIGSETVAA